MDKNDGINIEEINDNIAQKGTKLGLTRKQIDIAVILADPSETRTITKLCSDEGVPRRTFYNWMGMENFVSFVNSLVDQYSDAELSKVWRSLIKKAQDGDVQAIKLYFEMKGKYREVKELKHTGFTIESIIDMFDNGEPK
jgi:hypothetical protein